MKKVHIISFGYREFAVDSVAAATAAVALLAKLKPVTRNTDARHSKDWYYEPDEDRSTDIELKMNENYREPGKAASPLALPKPARGTILCICEKSYVAPRQSCPHCGRAFSESHNRTHGTTDTGPNLRLI